MKLGELLTGRPPARKIPDARALIRRQLIASGKRLAVIDDDPTGVQTVHDVDVYLEWTVEALRKAISGGEPVFFISTNSRSLSPAEAKAVSYEVGSNLREAARREGIEILLASRGDSTLRGHFPYEVEALAAGLDLKIDGIVIVPAFLEAGRYTVGDIHRAELAGDLVPVHLTEFARDPVFGYKNSDLKQWVEEKTGGAVKAGEVLSITLEMLRNGGPEEVEKLLLGTSDRMPVIANAACYEDLEVLALGVMRAEEKGKRLAYRCAASFIKARGGFADRPLLSRREMAPGEGPGLIIAGSYVGKTTRQINLLLDSGPAEGIEVAAGKLGSEDSRQTEIRSAAEQVNRKLASGQTVVLYTSREVLVNAERHFLDTGSIIMGSLCEIVRQVRVPPGYIITKGGITSIEIARSALGVKEARAIGQIMDGVPVLRFGQESPWPGIPFVVFPGNVGDDGALLKAVRVMEGIETPGACSGNI